VFTETKPWVLSRTVCSLFTFECQIPLKLILILSWHPAPPISSKWSLFLRFFHHNFTSVSHFPHSCYMSNQSCRYSFNFPNNTVQRWQVMELCFMQFYPIICYFKYLVFRYLPRTLQWWLRPIKLLASVDISTRAPRITLNEQHIMACTSTKLMNCTGMQDSSWARCPQREGR
jgi:hypothetical protein